MSELSYVVKHSLAKQVLFKQKAPLLRHLDIELTERCNNACIHCYINLPANDEQTKQRELTTEQCKAIFGQAANLGALSVRFTGGEPLLREDFEELYLCARHLGMKVTLFTNARLITPELADLFSRVPPLRKIEVTVYGMRPDSYDAIACVQGAFIEYQRGIGLLLERNIPFLVKSVLLPQNRGEMGEFEEWASKIQGMDRFPGYAVFLDFRARRDLPAKNRLISKLRFTPEEGIALLARDENDFRNTMAQYCAKFVGPSGDLLFNCGAGETGCVDAYGKYQMCMLLRHPDTVYDLRKGTIREALTEVFPKYRQLQATNPDYLERCARCFLKGLCEQCPAKSWSEHGTLDTPVEYLCQVAHAQARFLGLLAENEWGWEIADWKERVTALAEKYNPESIIKTNNLSVCNEVEE